MKVNDFSFLRTKLLDYNIFFCLRYVITYSKNMSLAPIITPSFKSIHYVGEPATIICITANSYSEVHWILNNTQYDHSQQNIEIITLHFVSVITINNISQNYNNTAIRCEDSYTNVQVYSSAEVTILLQGKSMQIS